MSKPTVIVSDLHLGAVPDAVQHAFVRFTRRWHSAAETLLINGDLFDFWWEYRTVIPSQHFHTLRALAELRESGVRLILVGGNHDAWGGPFLERQIGFELADGPLEMEIAGRRAFVAHGDGLGPGDLGYKALRRVLRSRPMRHAMRWVHPDLASRVARGVSRTRDRQDRGFAKARQRAAVLERYATELLEERSDLDLVIFGHCHTPIVKAVAPARFYVNTGDWVTNRTYTVVSEHGLEQLEWREASDLEGG